VRLIKFRGKGLAGWNRPPDSCLSIPRYRVQLCDHAVAAAWAVDRISASMSNRPADNKSMFGA
jgi:hypothetical protein